MRKITTVVYMMTNQPDLPSVKEYWFIRNNHIFCVMMTRFRDSPQLLIKCKSSEKNYLQLLKAFYSNNYAMLMMWLTLGQGHDTSSCHEQPLCNLCMNFLCFFFFKTVWTWHKMPCWWCDCDLGQMTLGQGQVTPLCHEQILCKVRISDDSFFKH